MYINPILFPQTTNREDFLTTFQSWDDDTFTPYSFDGTNVPGGAIFTSAAWTVTDGAIVTTSSTPISIPVYPIGAQLSALAITVGVGLGIKAGDPITIKDTATGLNTMTGYVTSYATATGALVCQIGWTFQCEIRKAPPNWQPGLGYTTFYDFGTADQAAILTASLANGYITIIGLGRLQIFIPEKVFKTLDGGTYAVAMTGTDGVSTRQLFLGRLPVLWGGVST